MDRKCEVCNSQDVEFVSCSGLSPTSYGYCRTCLEAGLEPLDSLVSVAVCSDIRTFKELETCFGKVFLEKMLEFHKETKESILKEISKGIKDMNKFMYEEWR